MEEEPRLTNSAEIEKILDKAKLSLEAITKAVTDAQELKKQLDTDIAAAKIKLNEISETAKQALAAKTKIEDGQTVIATKSQHIQEAQEHADKVRAKLDTEFTETKQKVTAIDGQKTKAEQLVVDMGKLLEVTKTKKTESESDAERVAALLKSSQSAEITTKTLADKSANIEKNIETYEGKLNGFEIQYAEQLEAITSLLPGATTAGLAQSFAKRCDGFLKPQIIWQVVFISSILVIIGLTGISFYKSFGDGASTLKFEELLLQWLTRMPVICALIWLAMHASREVALAKRLEEDYGYKSAIAEAFLGFHKQMSEIGKDAESNKPLSKLCQDTLTIIATPPGKIYENHKQAGSPIERFAETAETTAKIVSTANIPPKS